MLAQRRRVCVTRSRPTASLLLDGAAWQALDDRVATARRVADDPERRRPRRGRRRRPGIPVHADWHRIQLESGPYPVEGELATMPGFDPGRALTRPSGEFVLLRDVRLSVRVATRRPASRIGDHALVNRYAVDRIRADLMLGLLLPGRRRSIRSAPPAGSPDRLRQRRRLAP